jgi:hypothetical protein
MLKKYFDKISLITLKGNESRAEKSIKGMIEGGLIDSEKAVEVFYGIRGDDLPPPAWWRAGNGAWGCLQSHIHLLQKAWLDKVEALLILEDDVKWIPGAVERLEEIMPTVPPSWGQLYLGGQHRMCPEVYSDSWVTARSVNRTHAYAVSRKTIPKLLQHIQHAPDYIHSFHVKHIDHQLETAHQRGDWDVVAPNYWVAGQDENHSGISGRHNPPYWWDWCEPTETPRMPFLLLGESGPSEAMKPYIHEGFDAANVIRLRESINKAAIRTSLFKVYQESFVLRRLPAMRVESPELLGLRKELWKSDIVLADDLSLDDFKKHTRPENFAFIPPVNPDSESPMEPSSDEDGDNRR